jgi:hypothetical protein
VVKPTKKKSNFTPAEITCLSCGRASTVAAVEFYRFRRIKVNSGERLEYHSFELNCRFCGRGLFKIHR